MLTGLLSLVAFACAPQTAAAAPEPGLVSEWQGNGNANDSVGANNGTLVDGNYAPGQNGQEAFNLDGQNDYVSVPDSPSLEPSTAVSVSAWVKSTGPGNYGYIVGKGASGCSNASYALYAVGGGLKFYVDTPSGLAGSPDAGTGIWDGAWHFVVGAYNGTAVSLTVDGAHVGSPTPASGGIVYNLPNHNNLFIGAYDPAGCGLFFNGEIQDVKLYNQDISTPGPSDQPLTASPTPVAFEAILAGGAGYPIAWRFNDADPNANANDYSAVVNLGDGSPASNHLASFVCNPGVCVVSTPPLIFHVAGTFTATVLVTDLRGRNDNGGATIELSTVYQVLANAPPIPQQAKPGVGATALIGLGTIAGCLVALLPEPAEPEFALGCGTSLLVGSAGYVVASNDPADPRYRAIFLPQAVPVSVGQSVVCRGVHQAHACRALLRAAKAYAAISADIASVEEALAVSTDRYTGARIKGDAAAMLAQQAATYVYLHRLAALFTLRSTAGRRLLHVLPQATVRRHISATQLRQGLAGLTHLSRIPRWVRRRLQTDGITPDRNSLRELIHGLLAQRHNLRTTTAGRLLTATPSTSGFEDVYRRLTTLHLDALIHMLTAQRALPAGLVASIESADQQVLGACTASARAAAVTALLRVTGSNRQPASTLVDDAAVPLGVYRAGISPALPPCS